MRVFRILSLITLVTVLPHLVGAQVPPPEQAPLPEIPTNLFGCLPTDTLRICIFRILGQILRIILVIALALAALFVAWGGILYIFSGKPDEAKNKLVAAAAGLVVAFLAWVAVFLFTRFIIQGQA